VLVNFGGETAVQNKRCSTHRVEVGDREHHRNGKKDNFLRSQHQEPRTLFGEFGFWILFFCEPRYVAAEMILYMRFCEMESEHASKGHHNSSVYDLFYFIIFFLNALVDNSSEEVQVNRNSGLETYGQEFDTTNGGGQTYKPMK